MNKKDQLSALVFDVDGTLFDTLPALAAAANAVLKKAGLQAIEVPLLRPALSEGLLPMFRHALALQAEKVPADISAQLERDYLALYMQGGLMATKPFAGAAASLQAFATQGLRLAICTNRDRVSTDALLAAAAFTVDFEVIVGMGDAPRAKPAADPLLRVLELMDLSPAQALFIGDSAIDARCAQAAQVRFAAHRNGYSSHPDDLFPQVVGFESYDQLTPWVLRCLSSDKEPCHA